MIHLFSGYTSNPSTMKSNILLSFFLFSSVLLCSQTQADTKAYIEVTGYAERKVIPDEIYLSIFIKEKEDGRVKIDIEQQEIRMKNALMEIGISPELLTISDAQADYIRVKWSRKDVISQTEYELKLSTAQEVASVIEVLDSLKIDQAYISRATHSQIKTFQRELEIEAIQAAQTKADYLLTSIGQKTGKALIVKEVDNKTAQQLNGVAIRGSYGYVGNQDLLSQNKTSGKIEFRKLKLESAIYVKFEID